MKWPQKPSNEAQVIVDTIKDYIQEKGDDRNAWSAGISADVPEVVLLLPGVHHKHWTYCKTPSLHIAQEVLDYCVNTLGKDRNPVQLPHAGAACIVYVYKKAVRSTR